MDELVIAVVVGGVLSFGLQAIPGVRTKWSALGGNTKRWIVLALCIALPLIGTYAACNGYDLYMGASCPDGGVSGQDVIALVYSAGAAFFGMVGGYVAGFPSLSGMEKAAMESTTKAWTEYDLIEEEEEYDPDKGYVPE
jgi:hypothetical protein